MGIFEKKKTSKKKDVLVKAPEELETPGEEAYVESLSKGTETEKEKTVAEQPKEPVRQIPVCLSQAQINNMIIELDIKMDYVISKIREND